MVSLSKFVTGLSIALIAGMAIDMGTAMAEPPAATTGHALSVTVKGETAAPELAVPGTDGFLGELWSNLFGLDFVSGSSGLAATLAGASVDGEEIPLSLIGDFEESGFRVLRRWSIEIVGGGDVVGEADFTETSRTLLPGLSPSTEQLKSLGIASSTRTMVSGYLRNAKGQERELVGLVAETRSLDGGVVSIFTPMVGAEDESGAIAAAQGMAIRFGATMPNFDFIQQPGPIPGPGPVPGPGGQPDAAACRQRCFTESQDCSANALRGLNLCITEAGLQSAACNAIALVVCGFRPNRCMREQVALCMVAERDALARCTREYNTAEATCNNIYNLCINLCNRQR